MPAVAPACHVQIEAMRSDGAARAVYDFAVTSAIKAYGSQRGASKKPIGLFADDELAGGEAWPQLPDPLPGDPRQHAILAMYLVLPKEGGQVRTYLRGPVVGRGADLASLSVEAVTTAAAVAVKGVHRRFLWL